MPDSLVVQAARRFSAAFDRREADTFLTLSSYWSGAERRLSAQIDALALLIADRRRSGLAVTDGAIVRLERYQELLIQLASEWSSFAPTAAAAIDQRRLAEAEEGLRASQFTLRIAQEDAGLRVGFDRLNVEQARVVAGSMAGDPLGALLADAFGESLPLIRQRIFEAAALGHNPRKLAREITSASRVPLQRALVIARTETIRAYRETAREQYEASGVVKKYKRLARKAARTCINCLTLDGTVYLTSYEFAEHPSGRCTLLPIVEGAPVPAWALTGADYFARLPESEQRKRLGAGRFELYKSGGMGLRDLVEIREDPTWGGSPRLIPLRDLRAPGYRRPRQPFEIAEGGE